MYKGFFKDVEYVMGLFFKPFLGCCKKDEEDEEDEKDEKDEKDEAEKRECGMGCDCMPCCKEDDEDAAEEKKPKGGFLGPGPITDIMKCLFDASDIDYDYED